MSHGDRVPRGFSRRGFLVGTSAALAALGAGAAAVMGRSSADYERIVASAFGATFGATFDATRGASAIKPIVLSVKELAVLTVLVDRMLPDRAPFPTAREVGVALRIDKELSFHGEKLVSDTRAALFVVEHGGVLHGGVRPFTELSVEQQDARLIAMAEGNDIERQVVNGLRILALFFFYADERTWKHIGYDGPLVPQRTAPLADSRVTAVKIGKA